VNKEETPSSSKVALHDIIDDGERLVGFQHPAFCLQVGDGVPHFVGPVGRHRICSAFERPTLLLFEYLVNQSISLFCPLIVKFTMTLYRSVAFLHQFDHQVWPS
jgi:hypothetical protein